MISKIFLVAVIFLAGFLRTYKLGDIPASINWDEASLGYNAYSILKTGRDEHGKFFPMTNFAAFGDYKPPLYFYAAVPSIGFFSLNEFAIRFPSAFFGTLTVVITYLLSRKIFKDDPMVRIGPIRVSTGMIATFLVAVSPWHLQFSRGAFEANLGLFFSTLGIYLFFKFRDGGRLWIIPSMLSFLGGMYTFTGQRLFAPLMIGLLFWTIRRKIFRSLKVVFLSSIIFFFLFFPLFRFATQTIEGRLRFEEVTIFRDLAPINDSIHYREKDAFTLWANVFHNRRLFILRDYLMHYLDAFNPSFLFIKGDVNPRLSIQETGGLYYFELPLILLGLYFLFTRRQKYRFFLVAWLLISPLGPGTARETPHALRMLHILPSLQLIGAFGLMTFLGIFRFKKTLATLLTFIILLNVSYYLHYYYSHYWKDYSSYWQYGYKQAVEEIRPYFNQVDTIYVNKSLGRPYVYFLIYLKYDPAAYQKNAVVVRDQFYFLDVKSFDKLQFIDSMDNVTTYGRVIYVSHTEPPSDMIIIKQIKDLKDEHSLYIAKKGF